MSHEKASNIEQDVSDSLSIHSNIVVFGESKHLQLVAGKIIAEQSCNLKKLKGHNLSTRTMRFSMPAILLQIYANPCLYWLHEPAFYVLSHRIRRDDTIFNEMKEMKRIFAAEFVVNQNDEDAVSHIDNFSEFPLADFHFTQKYSILQRLHQSIKLYASLNILENEELSQLLLTSILPFVFCYLNVAEVILSQVCPYHCQNRNCTSHYHLQIKTDFNPIYSSMGEHSAIKSCT